MDTIETARLFLRPFRTDDAEMMYQNWTYDERVAQYCRWYPHQSVSDIGGMFYHRFIYQHQPLVG